MTDCMQHPYWNGESRNTQRTTPLPMENYFQANCRTLISILLKRIGTKLKQFVLTSFCRLGMFLHIGLAELNTFFVIRSTTFYSSTVFVMSMLIFFHHSCKLATMPKMHCVKDTILGTWSNLQDSYFIEVFPMYAKKKPVEYSPSGVL